MSFASGTFKSQAVPDSPVPKAQVTAPVKPTGFHTDLSDKFYQAEISTSKLAEVRAICSRILNGQDRYTEISKATGVPWYVIGCIHYKEASLNFKGYLGNGELIIGTDKKSMLVPSGRGPFASFEAGAIDALGNQTGKPWDLGSCLYFLEGYNGFGYRAHGINSPYLFAGTNLYTAGGYPRDHVWDPHYVMQALGCVALLKGLGLFSISKFTT